MNKFQNNEPPSKDTEQKQFLTAKGVCNINVYVIRDVAICEHVVVFVGLIVHSSSDYNILSSQWSRVQGEKCSQDLESLYYKVQVLQGLIPPTSANVSQSNNIVAGC